MNSLAHHTFSTPSLAFWETALSRKKHLVQIDKDFLVRDQRPTTALFASLIGDVRGMDVLDIGCGRGHLSVYLATRGARVTAIDFSEAAIQNTEALAAYNNVADRINFVHMNAMDLLDLDREYDLLVGRFVLHHIEPFEQFTHILREVMAYTGRGVFLENNAANPFLMLARNHLAGKLGIPRYGDHDEHPFEQREVDLLKERFRSVRQHFPEMVFLRKLNTYIYREKKLFTPLMAVNDWLDDRLYALFPTLHGLSYLQLIEFSNE